MGGPIDPLLLAKSWGWPWLREQSASYTGSSYRLNLNFGPSFVSKLTKGFQSFSPPLGALCRHPTGGSAPRPFIGSCSPLSAATPLGKSWIRPRSGALSSAENLQSLVKISLSTAKAETTTQHVADFNFTAKTQ